MSRAIDLRAAYRDGEDPSAALVDGSAGWRCLAGSGVGMGVCVTDIPPEPIACR